MLDVRLYRTISSHFWILSEYNVDLLAPNLPKQRPSTSCQNLSLQRSSGPSWHHWGILRPLFRVRSLSLRLHELPQNEGYVLGMCHKVFGTFLGQLNSPKLPSVPFTLFRPERHFGLELSPLLIGICYSGQTLGPIANVHGSPKTNWNISSLSGRRAAEDAHYGSSRFPEACDHHS